MSLQYRLLDHRPSPGFKRATNCWPLGPIVLCWVMMLGTQMARADIYDSTDSPHNIFQLSLLSIVQVCMQLPNIVKIPISPMIEKWDSDRFSEFYPGIFPYQFISDKEVPVCFFMEVGRAGGGTDGAGMIEAGFHPPLKLLYQLFWALQIFWSFSYESGASKCIHAI